MSRLRVRMRPDLVIERAGASDRWVVLDPVALRYFELRDEECAVLRMLDGRIDFAELRGRFERLFAPMRLSAPMLESFLHRLHENGLVLADSPGQGDVWASRRQATWRRAAWMTLANPLAIRLPAIGAADAVAHLSRLIGWMFSPPALLVAFVAIGWAAIVAAIHSDQLAREIPRAEAWFQGNRLDGHTLQGSSSLVAGGWWLATLAVVKCCHELGHALLLARWGGRVHAVGAMLFVFAPALYCDVSDAWRLPSRWRRVAVGLAGMGVELLLAAVAIAVWRLTAPGFAHALALKTLVVCSIGTIFFNANPLMRGDAYYVLSDLLNVPNLAMEARGALACLIRGMLLGADQDEIDRDTARGKSGRTDRGGRGESESSGGTGSARGSGGGRGVSGVGGGRGASVSSSGRILSSGVVRRWCLAAYGLLSLLCLVFFYWTALRWIAAALAPYGLTDLSKIVGTMVAVGMAGPPLVSVIRHWRQPARSQPWRWRRIIGVAIGFVAMIAAVWFVPMPRRVWAPIVLKLSSAQPVYVTVPGTLVWCLPAGSRVASGDVIARIENEALADEERMLAAELTVQELRVSQLKLRLPSDSSLAPLLPVEEERLRGLREQQGRLEAELDRLVLRAERSGVIVEPHQQSTKSAADAASEVGFTDGPHRAETAWPGSPLDSRNLGCYLAVGTALCEVGELTELEAEAQITLIDLPWVSAGQSAEMRLDSMPSLKVAGVIGDVARASEVSRSVDASHPDTRGDESVETVRYEARISFRGDAAWTRLRPGASGWARIDAAWEPLGRRLWRSIRRTFQD